MSSCTPGYIATDLTKDFLVKQGKTAKEAGMKTPAEVFNIRLKLEQMEHILSSDNYVDKLML